MYRIIAGLVFLIVVNVLHTNAQRPYWQQAVKYNMDIDMDVNRHQYTGKQTIVYTNNSPDTLDQVFYHLYFNAFQPGSMMDVRSRTLPDPDRRVRDRIFHLQKNEIGYIKVAQLEQDGKVLKIQQEGTILEVELATPILPGTTTTLQMEYSAQVPVQIRRSGRDNAEGIAYSMAQWYPKLCEYDDQGWHANPYIAREFYGVWGDFDVTIHIDSSYTVAASGNLQNPHQIGHGYDTGGKKIKRPKKPKLSWNFVAENVHDFVWAADPDYQHDIVKVPDGPTLHFFWQPDSLTTTNWKLLPGLSIKAFQYLSRNFGKYPYDTYSIIQGGDGGMEYPMATLITGRRSLGSLLGVTVHEVLHSWYQMILGTNESLYPWMDEGFTSYASARTMAYVRPPKNPRPFMQGSYNSYFQVVEGKIEQPMSTHSDHYSTNQAYGMAAYSKGAIALHQLSYIIGQEALDRGLKRYFNTWKFKHPRPYDFLRIMEKESDIELDWYLEYWMNSTSTIDYGFNTVAGRGDSTYIQIDRIGKMIMPLDVEVTFVDGRKETHYIPLRIMRGEKPAESTSSNRTIHEDWMWVDPSYLLRIGTSVSQIASIEIDPSQRMADVDRDNNKIVIPKGFDLFIKQ